MVAMGCDRPGYAPGMDLLDALGESWSGVTTLLGGLADDRWDLPSPCEGWTVHDVAAHLGHIEGMGHGFPQPPTPGGFDPEAFEGFHAFTEEGVAARRSLGHDEVLDEIRRASRATLERLAGFSADDWKQTAISPIGMVPADQAAEIRLADVRIHLLDLRHALGMEITEDPEPVSSRLLVDRALRLAGWGAVKGAGLPDGTRIGICLEGRPPVDLLIENRRGRLVGPDPDTTDRISGSGPAFVMAAAGRDRMVGAAGGLIVIGEAARAFLTGYRLFL